MKIKVGIGLDNIIFGMNQEEIENILGIPCKISKTGSGYGIVYIYNRKMVRLTFDRDENYKLFWIDAYHPKILMFNQSIINKTKKEINTLLFANGYSKVEYSCYDNFETLFCEEIWTTFNFEFNKLISIEFTPLINNNDEVIWPNR